MDIINIFKAIILGLVEGITEWLPVSSTGHMILVDEFLQLNMSAAFKEMFFVVIQLGAVMAVVVLYWKKLFPFSTKEKGFIKKETFEMWFKIVVACLPAAVVGILFNDKIDELFYNYVCVALALIIVGIVFIVVEKKNKGKRFTKTKLSEITYKDAIIIGLFQLIAAIFPGTSRSGATIIGAIMFGISRGLATEFTFFLAIPVMFGASLLKILKFGFAFTGAEVVILLIGTIVAFIVSIISIKFLTDYVKKHDFTVFGWYRIILGIIVILYFLAKTFIF